MVHCSLDRIAEVSALLYKRFRVKLSENSVLIIQMRVCSFAAVSVYTHQRLGQREREVKPLGINPRIFDDPLYPYLMVIESDKLTLIATVEFDFLPCHCLQINDIC